MGRPAGFLAVSGGIIEPRSEGALRTVGVRYPLKFDFVTGRLRKQFSKFRQGFECREVPPLGSIQLLLQKPGLICGGSIRCQQHGRIKIPRQPPAGHDSLDKQLFQRRSPFIQEV